jgi:tetratricopeptide (TPR) repeat protein
MRFWNTLFIILLLLFYIQTSKAQNTPQEEAVQLYEAGRFSEALPVFKRLVTLFPKDPRYQYYTGVCMVESNVELVKAIVYLNFASDKSVPRDVYFFLGKAYHYLYRFDEALDAYLKFQQFGERPEKERLSCDMYISMARNGKRFMDRQVVFDVYKIDSAHTSQLFDVYNRFLKNGKFEEKVLKTFPFSESKAFSTWCFMPAFLVKNQEVYETTTGSSRKNKDVAVVRKLDGNNWSRPENLGNVINTPYDEDYAYFNASEPALYFASKGHNSIGGYDIFKSVFNPDTRSWSEPVNMGYPINTPYDDYLFVPSEDQTRAIFTSNRDTRSGDVKMYTVSFSKKYVFVSLASDVNYVSRSQIRAVVGIAPVVNIPQENKHARMEPKPEPPVITPKEQVEVRSYPTELVRHKEYNEVLQAALQYQLQSDSMSRAAESIRQRLPLAKSEAETNKMKREIYLLEQRSKTTQVKADELYERARKFEIQYAGKSGEPDKSHQLTGEMARNAFSNQGEKASALAKESGQPQSSKNRKNYTKTSHVPVVYEFKIMAHSPYKALNDIPLNRSLPAGLLYRIQMGAFSKPIDADRFKGIMPICGEVVQNTSVTKYYAGMFSHLADAEKALIKVRECGFKDAYVVSFYDGKNIPINRAKELEKENQ